MATYNGSKYLEEQLASIANQTALPHELVIFDDRSNDKTVEIVERYSKDAPFPVRLRVNEKRLGYRKNFIEAAGSCEGDIIFFCDQDDVWHPEKISIIMEFFKFKRTLLVYHNAMVCDEARVPKFPLYHDNLQHRLINTKNPDPFYFSLGFTQAFRATLNGFNDLWTLSKDKIKIEGTCDYNKLAHDQWYIFLAQLLGGVEYCPRLLAEYRQHNDNVSGPGLLRSRSRLRAGLERALNGPGWDDLAYAQEAAARGIIAGAIAMRAAEQGWAGVADLSGRYRRLSMWLTRRDINNNGLRFATRMEAFARNLATGAYAPKSKFHLRIWWAFGDLIRAIFKS
jgi:glycosyltransferase involved in cell wall biosynthesis